MHLNNFLFLFLMVFISQLLNAEEASGGGKLGKQNILDFEADVIEGKKAKPDLFLQLDSGQQGAESFIRMRNDFNDFQQQDMRRLRVWSPQK
jgi:hypothetical protein